MLDGSLWIDIVEPTMEDLDTFNQSHSLNLHLIKDCLEPGHLPKYEEDGAMAFFILRTLMTDNQAMQVNEMSTKVAVFFNKNLIITVHRLEQPFLVGLREKYVVTGRVRNTSDLVIRIGRGVLNSFRDFHLALSQPLTHVEDLVFMGGKPEPSIFGKEWVAVNKNSQVIEIIYQLRKKVGVADRLCQLTDEVLQQLQENDIVEMGSELRDVMDYRLKLSNQLNESNENLQQLLQVYLSLSSQRTNEVMRVLTVFSVLFMPLTFIVGVYGMNFDRMPELHWSYGYGGVWLVMIIVVFTLFWWFRRRNWL